MREVASNLSRPQHQDVISDPFPSSIDIFETNVDKGLLLSVTFYDCEVWIIVFPNNLEIKAIYI